MAMVASPGLNHAGVIVPNEVIARVIGKAGAGLKQVREATGCTLDVKPSEAANVLTRRIDVVGAKDAIAHGVQQLVRRFSSDETTVNFTMWVPATFAGVIIGKGGDNLKRVREATGVRITVERDTVQGPGGEQERATRVEGAKAKMSAALTIAFGISVQTAQTPRILPQQAYNRPFVNPQMSSDWSGGAAVDPQTNAGWSRGPAVVPYTSSGCSGATVPPQTGSNGSNGGNVNNMGYVKPPDPDPEVLQIHVVVPEELANGVLGVHGQQASQTAAASGCTHVCLTRPEGASERRLVLVGTYSNCHVAQSLVYAQMHEAASETELELEEDFAVYFFIRKEAAGAVIGKKGSTLQRVREQTGVKLNLSRDEVEGQRPAYIAGSLPAVMQAQEMICNAIAQSVSANRHFSAAAPLGTTQGNANVDQLTMEYGASTSAWDGSIGDGCGSGNSTSLSSGCTDGCSASFTNGCSGGCGDFVGNGGSSFCGGGGCGGGDGSIGGGGCGVKGSFGGCGNVGGWSDSGSWGVGGGCGGGWSGSGHDNSNWSGTAIIGQKRCVKDDGDAGGLAKRQRTNQDQTKLLLPSQFAGRVIGKQGSGLKKIREQTGVHVDMKHQNEAPQWPADREFVIRGPKDARLMAMSMVLEAVYPEQTDVHVLKMLVASGEAGAVIGKQGGNLAKMREISGVKVQVDREEFFGERRITVAGEHNQVMCAGSLILTVLDLNNTSSSSTAAGEAAVVAQVQRQAPGAWKAQARQSTTGANGFWHKPAVDPAQSEVGSGCG